MLLLNATQDQLREEYQEALENCPVGRKSVADHLHTTRQTIQRKLTGKMPLRAADVYAMWKLAHLLADAQRMGTLRSDKEFSRRLTGGGGTEPKKEQPAIGKNPKAHHTEKDWDDLDWDDIRVFRQEVEAHKGCNNHIKSWIKNTLDDPKKAVYNKIKDQYGLLQTFHSKCEERMGKLGREE